MRTLLVAIVVLAAAANAGAEPASRGGDGATRRAAERGAISPIVRIVPTGAASVRATGGWDTASDQPIAGADGDVRVWRRLRIVGGAQWADRNGGRLRPYGGAAYLLGKDAAVSLIYRPEGFTEPEGELELGFDAAHRFGPAALVANLTYGQDPEARERDAEQALAATFRAGSRVWVGAAERARISLAAPRDGEPAWDVSLGPHAAVDAGPVVVFTFVGAVARSIDDATQTGVAASVGVVRAF